MSGDADASNDRRNADDEGTATASTSNDAPSDASRREEGPTLQALTDFAALNNELVTMQRELARANAQLARVSAQKSEVLGTVAHDLRSPLSVVATLARHLLDRGEGPLSPAQEQVLAVMASSLDTMKRLVDSLLDLRAIESGLVELVLDRFELGRALAEEARLAEPLLARRGLRVALDLDRLAASTFVEADRAKLHQVLANLLGNAAKFAPEGSCVTLRAEPRGETCDATAEARVRVEVIDEGPGIPVAEQSRLFQPFGRTSVGPPRGETSTGLGLAIARRIVDAHGGVMGVRSEVGRGSCFHFELPLRRSKRTA